MTSSCVMIPSSWRPLSTTGIASRLYFSTFCATSSWWSVTNAATTSDSIISPSVLVGLPSDETSWRVDTIPSSKPVFVDDVQVVNRFQFAGLSPEFLQRLAGRQVGREHGDLGGHQRTSRSIRVGLQPLDVATGLDRQEAGESRRPARPDRP